MEQLATQHEYNNPQEQEALTEAFFNLCSHWNLARQEEASLLGWDYAEKRTKIDSLRKGKTILEKDQDKIGRIIDLINIHKSLRVLFPYDRSAVYEWVKIPRERFGGHSALDIMISEGRMGIAAIRQYLDHELTR